MTNIRCLTLLVTCAAVASPAIADDAYRAKAISVIKRDFQPRGQATLDRLAEDGLQAICNRTGNKPPEYIAKRMEADQLAGVKYPADGKLMGDWKEGEKIAQSGRGFTWSDKADEPAGGNCYNCHQIDKAEISFGTIGPSLYNFGKLRGVTDPASPASKAMVEYTWGKIWNAKAYNACSNMPRAGHMGILTEAQVADLVALLLDPKSPVNQ